MVSFSRRPKHRDAIFDKDDDKIFHRVATNVEPPRDRRHPKAPTETERTGPRGKDAGISICTILFRASFARTQWQKSGTKSIDRTGQGFSETKKKTEICNPKFNTMFFFLLLQSTYITYQQRLLRPRGLAFRGVLKENAVGRHFTRMTKFSSTLLSNAWTT